MSKTEESRQDWTWVFRGPATHIVGWTTMAVSKCENSLGTSDDHSKLIAAGRFEKDDIQLAASKKPTACRRRATIESRAIIS